MVDLLTPTAGTIRPRPAASSPEQPPFRGTIDVLIPLPHLRQIAGGQGGIFVLDPVPTREEAELTGVSIARSRLEAGRTETGTIL
jgi:hypothetical protein